MTDAPSSNSPSTAPTDTRAFVRARTQLVLGAAFIALGLALSGTLAPSFGGVVAFAGWVLAVLGLHRLGRSGPG